MIDDSLVAIWEFRECIETFFNISEFRVDRTIGVRAIDLTVSAITVGGFYRLKGAEIGGSYTIIPKGGVLLCPVSTLFSCQLEMTGKEEAHTIDSRDDVCWYVVERVLIRE